MERIPWHLDGAPATWYTIYENYKYFSAVRAAAENLKNTIDEEIIMHILKAAQPIQQPS